MIKIEKCTQLIEQNSVLLQKFNDQWKLVVFVTAFCYAWSDIVFFIRLSVGWTLANNRFTFVYDWNFQSPFEICIEYYNNLGIDSNH